MLSLQLEGTFRLLRNEANCNCAIIGLNKKGSFGKRGLLKKGSFGKGSFGKGSFGKDPLLEIPENVEILESPNKLWNSKRNRISLERL